MSDPIRTGVIGFGLAGRVFHTAFIGAVPGLELTTIVQRKGNEAAAAYPAAKVLRSVDELLADESIRLVVVATGNATHFELARQSLHAGKDVVVDKPFTLTSGEAAELIALARERSLVISAYQNRRWDGDFKTVRTLLDSGRLGRLVTFESHFDRFREAPRFETWKESGAPGGGMLYDLGPHLIDQALTLFGVPEYVTADVRIDRDLGVTDDAFDIRLGYPRMTVLLRSTLTAAIPGPRFTLHGTHGSYVKYGLDPQEDAFKHGAEIGSPRWGEEPQTAWGTLKTGDGPAALVPTEAGDYRGYYENVRDALLGTAQLAVTAEDAWRTARIIELARESSAQSRTLPCDLGPLP